MASYKLVPDKAKVRVWWRFRGEQHSRLFAGTERDARRACDRIEDAILRIEQGRLVIPEGADVRAFLFSGGEAGLPSLAPALARGLTIAGLAEAYRADPPPHLEASTASMVAIHLRRVGEKAGRVRLDRFDLAEAQRYVSRRAEDEHRGRKTSRKTIGMELQSLRQVAGWVSGRIAGVSIPSWSIVDLKFPKARAVEPFKTWDQIQAEVRRGGHTPRELGDLWACLWLDSARLWDLIDHVRGARLAPFFTPMVVGAAFSGARRSELCRSQVGDWRLEDGYVQLRQKKRDRDREYSFRRVDLAPASIPILRAWFDSHPGGGHAFCQPDREPITPNEAAHTFRRALAGSKWRVVRGWHVLRHSFASILASAGVDQRVIDEFMGHSTEIRKRYMHLCPDLKRDSVQALDRPVG